MNISDFLRRKQIEELRQQHRSELEALGYTLVQGGKLANGNKLLKGYTVVAASGEILDNDGMGYISSRQALTAARRHAGLSGPE